MKDFIQEFNQEYYPYTWDQQYEKIKLVVKELFIALKKHKPEMAECKKVNKYFIIESISLWNGFDD